MNKKESQKGKSGEDMQTKNMTKGNVLELLLKFAIPLFIGNIFQQLYSIFDTVVLGYSIGDHAIAAVGATSALAGLIINFSIGLNNGFAINIANNFGSNNLEQLRKSIASTISLNLIITLIISVLTSVFMGPVLRMMNVPKAIFEDAYIYIIILTVGMITTIMYNMFAGIMRAFGNSKSPLFYLIISTVLNIILNLLLVVIFQWGIAGAAIATVVSQGISAILAGINVYRSYRVYLPYKEDWKFEAATIKELLSSGFAMALMFSFIDLGSVIYSSAVNNLGDVIITAHAASRRIIIMFVMVISSIATANSTFISQNWGAGRMDRIEEGNRKSLYLGFIWSAFTLLVAIFFGKQFVVLITDTSNPEIINVASFNFLTHAICFVPLTIFIIYRTALQGVGKRAAALVSSGIELAFKIVSGFILIPAFGYNVVYFTEPLIWIVCTIYLITYSKIKKPLSVANKE